MADPGALARKLVQKHFKKFGSFRTSVTYTPQGNGSYDATTGVFTPDEDTSFSIYVIIDSFSSSETNYSTRRDEDEVNIRTDKKLLVPAADMEIIPAVGDLITVGSTTYRVKGDLSDPKPALYQLWIRPL